MESVYLVVILGAAVAGFIQGLSGFAFGVIAISFWAWVLEPRLAATLVVFGALVGQILAAFSVRRGFHLKDLLPFLLGGLAGIPIGITLLPILDVHWFKAILGTILILWAPTMLLSKQLPQITKGGRIADSIIGLTGGILGGIGGFAGIIPTLWCTLRGYNKIKQRAIIQNFNLSMLCVTMGSYLATGIITPDMLPMFAIVAPAMLIPTLLGTKLYASINEARFRQIVLSLLTISGIAMLISSVPHL